MKCYHRYGGPNTPETVDVAAAVVDDVGDDGVDTDGDVVGGGKASKVHYNCTYDYDAGVGGAGGVGGGREACSTGVVVDDADVGTDGADDVGGEVSMTAVDTYYYYY